MKRDELIERLQSLRESQGLTLRSISKSLQISESALSQWLSGKYPGDADSIDEKIAHYLRLNDERRIAPRRQLKFVETTIVKKIFEVARWCHLDGEMGVVYGQSGIGKTYAVREYVNRNLDAILIEIDDRYANKTAFVRELHRRLGGDGNGKLQEVLDVVVERLKYSGRLLIVDEAEKLPYRTLELIRRLHDFTEIGVLLVGMPELIDNLRGKRRQYAQIYSRITVPCQLTTISLQDTEQVVKSIIPNANGLVKVFHENCMNSMRILRTLVLRSIRTAEINGGVLDAGIIREVRKGLIA
jgi:hypothetical protein